MRNKIIPIGLLVLLFIGYVALERFGPQGDEWKPRYGMDHDSPFGSRLVFEGLADLFPEQPLTPVEEAPSDHLREFRKEKSNYIIIQQTLDMGQRDADALVRYVENGNTVFVAASVLDGYLGKALDIDSNWFWDRVTRNEFSQDSYLTFGDDDAEESELARRRHYPMLDNVYYSTLGYFYDKEVLSTDEKGEAVMTRISRGEGELYLHTVPLMFTNFYMVDPVNQEYIARALSFLPVQPTFWDEYYKPERKHVKSPASYILSEKSLNWAWMLLLGTIILFIVFEGKRRQRPIPIVQPPANDTLEFTRTIGRLYLAHGDHKDIAEKKIKYFLEYVRNRWYLDTRNDDAEFRRKLALKSGVKPAVIDNLFNVAQKVEQEKKVDEPTLQYLHAQIETFHSLSR